MNQAKGNFDGPRQAFDHRRNDQLMSSEHYRPLIVAYRNGAPVRLSEVADVIDGAENVRQAAWMNDDAGGDRQHPAPARREHHRGGGSHQGACCRSCKASLPPSVHVTVLTDRTDNHPRVGAVTCSSS